MESVKKTKDFIIYKKRSGRHAVLDMNQNFIKGEDKTKILLKEGLIKLSPKKKKEEPAAETPSAS